MTGHLRRLSARLRARLTRRGPLGSDVGITLIELTVTISLISVLGSVMLYGVINNSQLHRLAADESTGLADVKTVVERLGRDIRSARSVYPGATTSELVLWIDTNSDYLITDDEIITWQLVQQTEGGEQYNVIRQTEGGDPTVQARTLVSDIAFCYWTQNAVANQADCDGSMTTPLSTDDAADVRLVTTTTTYDALTNTGTEQRQMSFSSRLRNVE